MKRSLVLIALGLSCVVWMIATRPPASPAATIPATRSPAIVGDVSSASWSAKCQFDSATGQTASIDPIKYWGGTGPHLHAFVAPTLMGSMVSPGMLLALAPEDAAECVGPTVVPTWAGACTYSPTAPPGSPPATASICDKSAYWVPVLFADGDPTNTLVAPTAMLLDHMNIYWRNEYTHPQSDSPFPSDFAEVGGNAMAMTPQNWWIVNWQCVDDVRDQDGDKTETPGPVSNVIPTSCEFPASRVCHPHCDPVYLRLVITMPECVLLTTNPTQGMALPASAKYAMTGFSPAPPSPTNGTGYHDCILPNNSWQQIMPIQVDPHWLINKGVNTALVPESTVTETIDSEPVPFLDWDLSKLLLSSDLMMDQMHPTATVTPGTTSHADYENGYSQVDIDGLIATCFLSGIHGMNCGSI